MTDTTPTPTPINTPEQHTVLMDSIAKYLLGMIESIVERKVNQIMENHASLRFIDDAFSDRIREIADEAVREHESDNDHESRDDISDAIATHIAHTDFSDTIRRSVEEIISDGDYPTEERVQEMMDDIDLEEKVKDVLRNI
jgi:hypothetical protein